MHKLEQWRVVAGHDGYEVSNLGRVRSWRKRGPGNSRLPVPVILNPSPDRDGYLEGRFSNGSVITKYKVHRVVLEAFGGPQPTPHHQAAHSDGNRVNNLDENLRWATPKENSDDRIRHGNGVGATHGCAVLTIDDVRYIRTSDEPALRIAKRLGVYASTVSNARRGKTWKSLHV